MVCRGLKTLVTVSLEFEFSFIVLYRLVLVKEASILSVLGSGSHLAWHLNFRHNFKGVGLTKAKVFSFLFPIVKLK